ncbi:MAG: cobyric acid synthase [Pseudomonadota bacterium]
MAKALMIQGAGSNVGKSVLVAGLVRVLSRRGSAVAPFKPQNMSNNAAVTEDGGEIGRAQALQARAAGRAPLVDMNPVLLKPESETGAQVIVQGRRLTTARARDYARLKPTLLPRVLESFTRLAAAHDWVIVEGAGSPAEINLRPGDIANMGFAEAANVPVVLIGDIDRGGVIAQLVGTQAVLPPSDAARIKGFAVNKFRGDTTLFHDGMAMIAEATGWTPLGIIPWFGAAAKLPAEDILDIAGAPGEGVKIAVPRLPRIANFDDLDPLSAEPGVEVDIVEAGRALPGDAAAVILPGSKSTISDLAALRAEGWDVDIAAHIRRGGYVMGICGGYQMMGRAIHDPEGLEGPAQSVPGLDLLEVETVMEPMKRLALSRAATAGGTALTGYEIHLGRTEGRAPAWLHLDGRPEGASARSGRLRGCYIHGLFTSDAFRAEWLAEIGGASRLPNYEDTVEETLDALADHLEAALDLDALFALAGEV